MSATTRKAGKRSQNGAVPATQTGSVGEAGEVLTLTEAAAYLRVGDDEVLRLANLHELPGRQIGGEWRFLKAGLQDWLRTPPLRSGKEALLALAGAWQHDPDVEQIVREAHRRRGRPAAERDE
jgi:excisionase family DNA binding protein